MREPPAVREATVAFMHGYFLGKSNSVKFNVEKLLKHTDNFIDSCLDNPGAKAIDVMTKTGG
jgi:HdeA/HdeB family